MRKKLLVLVLPYGCSVYVTHNPVTGFCVVNADLHPDDPIFLLWMGSARECAYKARSFHRRYVREFGLN